MIGLGISIPKIAINSEGGSLASLISSLFRNNEQGVWYDPSDMSTMFQDSVGNAPVTAVEQPVGLILDKSKGLVLGPELVAQTNTPSAWNSMSATPVVLEGGQIKVTFGGASFAAHSYLRSPSLSQNLKIGGLYRVSGKARVSPGGSVNIAVYSGGVFGGGSATITSTELVSFSYFIVPQSNDIYLMATDMGQGETIWLADISVRELPGNHATQTTSTSRPVLSARVNLLTKTEQFDDAAWTKTNVSVTQNAITAPDGTLTADALFETTTNGMHRAETIITTAAAAYTYSVYLLPNGRTNFNLEFFSGSGGAYAGLILTGNGAIYNSGVYGSGYSNAVASVVKEGNWYRCTLTATVPAVSMTIWNRMLLNASTASYAGDTSKGIYIWGASLVPANQASLPYQRVNTATDYDTAGFPHYLRFDGTDDFLVTPSINFTSTDKMTVFAGVRKLSDGVTGVVAELSSDINTNNQCFTLLAPSISGSYRFFSKGTLLQGAGTGSFAPAPDTSVITGIGNISSDIVSSRRNGALLETNSTDQGAGNYGNYPLYIGRRNGTTFPFNGHLYSLIIRGAQSTAQQIANAEKYVAIKTGFSKPSIIGLPTIGL